MLFATDTCPDGKYDNAGVCTGKYLFVYDMKTI